jgi:hypothetical protein
VTASAISEIVDDFLANEYTYHPVDASFAGARGYDDRLPPVDAEANARERTALEALAARLDALPPGSTTADRLDHKLARAQITHRLLMLAERPLAHNPTWATGEAAFGIVSLLLRDDRDRDRDALRARVAALPDFLRDARERLGGVPVPREWCERARRECGALDTLLSGLDRTMIGEREREHARRAARSFAAAVESVPDADPACGERFFGILMRDVHGLRETPAQLEARAEAAFAHAVAELDELAARIDPTVDRVEQLARLDTIGPQDPSDVLPAYRRWDARTLADARTLLTPAADYGLTYAEMPPWAEAIASDLYFLFYRSPRALDPGTSSTYWVPRPSGPGAMRAHNEATMKLVHVVHHGSIGHHTQNARARAAASRLARVAGTDTSAALAFLSSGTMVEGWACYAQELMAEIPGYYTPGETLALKAGEMRNIGCALADVRLHTGRWSVDDVQRFYRDGAGFAPTRIANETTRNSMFPASRIMYWLGVESIKAMRAASTKSARDFHDTLLSFGAAPTAWIAEEMNACA